jgi:hypothetical protein
MSQGPPTRPARKPSEEPRVRFNWPPTEDELAQYGGGNLRPETEFEETALQARKARGVDASLATGTAGLFASETEPEPFPAPSSVPESWTPVDGARTPSDDEDFEHSWVEATSISGIAVSPAPTAVDPPGTGDFADEVAYLQALIEGLTQTIEWRLPTVTRR